MKAMVLDRIYDMRGNAAPLRLANLPDPFPREREVLVKVITCGVCHTELDEIEGRTPPPRFPVVLGHQVVGRVQAVGPDAHALGVGERVGIAWIGSACGHCKYCLAGDENLCPEFVATGRDINGGYAQYMTVREDFAYRIPDVFSDAEAAPLLCAGAIGYRSLRLCGLEDGENLGLVGFGASAHLVLKMVRHQCPKSKVFVFARSESERAFARELGAEWAGDIAEVSPDKLRSIIDTTPAWRPVVEALKNLGPGGRLVINAIRKEEADKEYLLRLDYPAHLWMEKEIKSVANVARRDVSEFLALAAEMRLKPEVQEYALEDANMALVPLVPVGAYAGDYRELKKQGVRGAKVLRVG